MDKIEIKKLEIFANHGVFPEENVLGQKFVISATLYTDTRKAGLTDELTASIHYGEVSHMITKFTKEHTYKLLETLAENLCQMLLQELPLLKMITLRVEKPWAPVGLPLETVAVEITRGWHTAYVAFGSNLGDKKKFLDDGIQGLRDTPSCEVEAVSEYLVTEPYGGVEQDEFLNGVLKLRTLLTPEELLDRLHKLEAAANRERIIHWGPRTLELGISDGNVLPHLAMRGTEEKCVFLNQEGRCSIHEIRPGFCRLFPLGRYYTEDGFKYIIQIHECAKKNRSKIKVKKWIDTPDLRQYEKFVWDWHQFLLDLQEVFYQTEDADLIKNLNMYVLSRFYTKSYEENRDFYEQFYERLEEAKKLLSLGV